MPTVRIAIAAPSLDLWSETFITAHLQRLSGIALVLNDGIPPRQAGGRSLVQPTTWQARLHTQWELRVAGLDLPARLQRHTVKALRQSRATVLLAEYGTLAASLVPVCRTLGLPLVAHFHGRDAHAHARVAQWGHYKELIAYASAIVVVSRTMEQRLLELGAPREKVVYNVYGIDLDRFTPGQPAATGPHFVGIGRFVDKKAPHLTLLAFREVLARRPDVRLTLAGDGPLREACIQMVKAWGMEDQVDLPGVFTPDQVAHALHTARAFVQHSVVPSDGDSEGTPLAVLEAMACGLPVVATRHAGIGDVVAHGERGLLCAEYDVDAMATHMAQLSDDPALAGRMGQMGRTYVEKHHRVEDSVARLQALLERVSQRQRS